MLGLSASLSKAAASMRSYVKSNLKLYLDFKSNKSDTLKFPCEGSTSFDGTNDYISIADDSTIDITGDFSITMWAKFDTFPSSSAGEAILQKGDQSSNRAYGLSIYNTSGDTNTQILLSTDGSNWFNTLKGSTNLSVGTWYHISATYDGTTVKLYLDGVLDSSEAETDDIQANSSALVLGYNGSAGFMDGRLANVGIWSRALSLEEVNSVMRKNYSQLKTVEKTSLVMWQSLDSASNGVVTPASGETLGSDLAPTSWTGTNATTSESTDYAHSGTTSRKYITSGTGGIDGIYTSAFTTVQNALYKLDMWVYSPSQGDIYVRIAQGDGSGYNINEEITIATGEWVNIVRYFVELGSSVGFAELFFGNNLGSAVTQYIDDISIKAVTSNTGVVTGATTTTSVYGGNAPVLPRAVDVAREGEAEAIGSGSALFNGSSNYISIADNDLLSMDGDQKFSICAWVYMTEATDFGIVSKGAYNSTGEYIFDTSGSDELRLTLMDESVSNTYEASTTSSTITQNTWNHVACTYNGVGGTSANAGIKLYINGINQAVALSDSGTYVAMENLGADLFIGKYDTSLAEGNISQVGIWKGELTQAQVQSVMESTSYAKIPADVKSTLGSELVTSITNFSSQYETFTTSGNTITNADNSSGGTAYAYSNEVGASTSKVYKIVVEGTISGTVLMYAGQNEGSYTAGDFKTGTTHSALVSGTNTYYVTFSATTKDFLWLQTSASSSFTDGSISVKEVTNDLVGYWALDADNSEPSLYFDGSSNHYITVPNSTSLQVTTIFSLIAWARLDDFSNDSYANIFGKGNDYMIQQDGTNDDLKFTIFDGSWNNAITTTSPLTEKEWFHTVATYDGSTMKVYANGVLQKEVSLSSSAPQNSADLTIAGSGGNHWKGEIASCAVTNTTLSASEILTMYNNGISADISSTSGLVGYWKLNTTSTSSGAITDLSGNGNDGTLTGTPTLSSVALDSITNKNIGALL